MDLKQQVYAAIHYLHQRGENWLGIVKFNFKLYLSEIQKLKPGQITPPINNINNTV